MTSEQMGDAREFDETAVFFLASKAQQKLEVSYNTRFLYFRKDFQIVLDGVCLESRLSEKELKQGKTYPLPDDKTLEIEFLGNRVVVWVDGELIPLDDEENNRQNDLWKSVTLTMYIGGGICFLAGLLLVFPLSEENFLSLAFWINSASFIFLGAGLLVCGYVGQHQQRPWALRLGNSLLLIFLMMWFYHMYWVNLENYRSIRVLFIILFILLGKAQVQNTRKIKASLNETKTVSS